LRRSTFNVWRLRGATSERDSCFPADNRQLPTENCFRHLACLWQPSVYSPTMKLSFDRRIQKAVDDPAAMRVLVKEGLEIEWFDDLARRFGASGAVFSTIVGIDPRTLTRRRREGKLTPRESNALYHLAVLYEHALDVLGDPDTVRNWFNTPEPDFSEMIPLALLDSAPGMKEVDHLLGRIEHGVF
jgi:putative toxin-antitoxin system antitoxin component (TIGR02293 family)